MGTISYWFYDAFTGMKKNIKNVVISTITMIATMLIIAIAFIVVENASFIINKQQEAASKITAYLDLLSEKGLSLGEPYIKHLEDNIWELRPLRDRILFAYLDNNNFILLNYFMKKTQKTPLKEIESAKRNLEKYFSRGG